MAAKLQHSFTGVYQLSFEAGIESTTELSNGALICLIAGSSETCNIALPALEE